MKLIRKIYTTRREKTIDFIIGFVGWFVIDSLYFLLLSVIGSLMGELMIILMPFFCLPLPITIIALVTLIRMGHRRIALGALSAFAVNSIGMILVNPLETDEPGLFLINIAMGIPFFLENLLGWLGFQI